MRLDLDERKSLIACRQLNEELDGNWWRQVVKALVPITRHLVDE